MSYKDDQTLRDLNKALDGLDKELREKKRQQLNTRFALGAEILRKDGTKERKIQEIFKRTYETWRQARDTPPDDPEIRSGLENPEAPVRLIIEPPGVKLSGVKTQQIDWLWQRRIPLGKITILDGDPGMGKSLLAINIAACISTGRPMPDDTPGRQGSIILIAPEDSAEDTIKPRMEAAGGDPSKVFLLNSGTNLSFERQEILRVLKDAEGPLEAREIAELTGQNYRTIRMALSRMHEAGVIARPYRGNYTTPDHPSITKGNAPMNDVTSDASVTSDANVTNPASDLAPPEFNP